MKLLFDGVDAQEGAAHARHLPELRAPPAHAVGELLAHLDERLHARVLQPVVAVFS